MEPAQGGTIQLDKIGYTEVSGGGGTEEDIGSWAEKVGVFSQKSELESDEDGESRAIID